jgi:hypothetical protein
MWQMLIRFPARAAIVFWLINDISSFFSRQWPAAFLWFRG